MHPVDAQLHRVAAAQAGTFSRRQAADAGATSSLVRSRLATGRWLLVADSVLAFPGHAIDRRHGLWVAHLHAGPGSVLSHESAGEAHALDGVPPGIVALSVPRNRRRPPAGVLWHRIEDLSPAHVVRSHGLPVTSVPRTLVDLGAVLRTARYRHVVESALVDRRVTVEEVGSVLAQLRRRGKPGVRAAADALDVLGPGDGLPHRRLELLLDRVVERSGLPAPRREHPLPEVRGLTGFVDRWFPAARLIVEADGRKWHTRRSQLARDRERDIAAARHGIQTLRFVWEHLAGDPDTAVDDLCTVHAQRLALFT